jgi:adenine-specific DNA methylase
VDVNTHSASAFPYNLLVKIEFQGNFAASAAATNSGSFLLVSQTVKNDQIHLLLVQQVEIRGNVNGFLKQKIKEVEKNPQPLDAVFVRQNLSSSFGSYMTQHLMRVHEHLDKDSAEVVIYTAWRYSTLITWGEASAARELALELHIPVHTVHNRLRIARDRGILSSPGPGSRLGK